MEAVAVNLGEPSHAVQLPSCVRQPVSVRVDDTCAPSSESVKNKKSGRRVRQSPWESRYAMLGESRPPVGFRYQSSAP